MRPSAAASPGARTSAYLVACRAAAWLAPLVPLIAGAAVMVAAGAPRARWAMHLASGAAGLTVYFVIRTAPRGARASLATAAAPVMLGVLAVTLLGEGLDGVHRWVRLGPILLHPSALFAPLFLILAGRRMDDHPWTALLGLGLFQAIHVAQPDAGQATAFGLAALVLVLLRHARLGRARAALAAAVLPATIALAWTRPDPLLPAPFVEDIVQRAFGLGRVPGVLALVSLLPLVSAPLLGRGAEGAKSSGVPGPERLALVVYLACAPAVVLLGEFPVPVLGFGASPVLGVLAALAALASGRPGPRVAATGMA